MLRKTWFNINQGESRVIRQGPFFVALAGFVLFLGRAINYAFTQRSIVDEGMYLYKGYLFVLGIYKPFQDYGFWTQKAPLSYLIYGWIQQLFGPGLRTGRYFSIFLGALAILGLALVACRIGGRWWGAVVVWVVALNTVSIRYFSIAMSQSLVACLLMWMLFFTLGKERSRWQLVAGSLCAGIMVMARQNMAPVLIILPIYLIWMHGWKTGLLAGGMGLVPLIVIQAVYWPDVLKMWAPWLPESLTPFLDSWRLPPLALAPSNSAEMSSKIKSLLEGFRYHFAGLTGGLSTVLLWPTGKLWKDRNRCGDSVFLMILFLALLGLHLWAGLGNTTANNNNAFTFSPYLSFFDLLGILCFVSVSNFLNRPFSIVRQGLLTIFILAVSGGIGFGGYEVLGEGLANLKIPRILTFISTGKLLPGYVPLWDFANFRFGIGYETSRMLFPAIVIGSAGLMLLVISLGIWVFLRRKIKIRFSFTAVAIILFLLVGTLFSSTEVLGGGFQEWTCSGNVIQSFEQSGKYLAEGIPPHSQVYWDGDNAAAVLLYIPDIRIFPPQVDGDWNFAATGDSNLLAKFGFWDKELALRWQTQATVFLFQEQRYLDWAPFVENSRFYEPPASVENLNCAPGTYLRVFVRNP
jgi:hypothetical protein